MNENRLSKAEIIKGFGIEDGYREFTIVEDEDWEDLVCRRLKAIEN